MQLNSPFSALLLSRHRGRPTCDMCHIAGALQRIYGELYPTVTVCSNGARFTARFKPPFAYSISLNWAPPELVGTTSPLPVVWCVSTLLTDCFGVPADYMPRELDSLACGSSLKLHEANTVVEYTNSHDGINGVRRQC